MMVLQVAQNVNFPTSRSRKNRNLSYQYGMVLSGENLVTLILAMRLVEYTLKQLYIDVKRQTFANGMCEILLYQRLPRIIENVMIMSTVLRTSTLM